MQTSTLVLTALAQLNEELINDDAFCGYNDDPEGTARLLDELWAQVPHVAFDATPDDLIDAWYSHFFAKEGLCAA